MAKLHLFVSYFFMLLGLLPARTALPSPASRDTAQIDIIEVQGDKSSLPPEFTFRARIISIQPEEKADLNWRYGGEAQGGNVISGKLGKNLAVGQWTESVPLISLAKEKFPPAYMNRVWFITFTSGSRNTKSFEVEFEFSLRGKVVKTFKEGAPNGATVGIAIPHARLAGNRQPDDPQFLAELSGLLDYAQRRADAIEKLPWANWPLPKKLMVVSDISGYGEGVGYGIRHGNRAIIEAETRTMRQMGANSLRAAPKFLLEMGRKQEGFGQSFGKGEITHAMGFPVPSYRKDRSSNDPEAGCPFGSKVAQTTAQAVRRAVEENINIPVEQVWALTVDEIGSVFDHSAEGKNHMDTCPRCIEAFRNYTQSLGATPQDFGQANWKEVKPSYSGGPGATAYYSRKFNNHASARLFSELMKTFEAENAKKREALTKSDKNSPAATQPWLYSYALRGNTFLMAGHSLDFFDFYRLADNAFVYETSNTGRQIWQWDSYLCDVGRVVSQATQKQFGIYVKPHRGAPVQRALTAVSRGATMLYWYTYGPEYYKGDSFADNPDAVALASKAAHLIGKAESVLYGSKWAIPPEVAIIKPRCSEFLGNDAQWENAKWVYTALAHAHIPVDPIDEVILAQENLSRYKIIYVNGSHLPRASAKALAKWVEAGGVLWTSGYGCALDEASEPLRVLQPVLGLEDRTAPELYYKVDRYRATAVQSFTDSRAKLGDVPPGAKIEGITPYTASFLPVVGREVLKPAAGTRVLAKFADGNAAMTVHNHGKGKAYVVGFYPGLEYSASIRDATPDMSKDFDAARLTFMAVPALELTKPVVAVSVPAVEGVLLKNPDGKQAVTLMNWGYKTTALRKYPDGKTQPVFGIAELKDVQVTVRGAGSIKKARSCMLERELPVVPEKDAIGIIIPELQEGEVLLLE